MTVRVFIDSGLRNPITKFFLRPEPTCAIATESLWLSTSSRSLITYPRKCGQVVLSHRHGEVAPAGEFDLLPSRPKTASELRLKELADFFAAAVGGFSVMDNRLHAFLCSDPHVDTSTTRKRRTQHEKRLAHRAGHDRPDHLSDRSAFEPIGNDRVRLEEDAAWISARISQPAVVLDEVIVVLVGLRDEPPRGNENRFARYAN